MTNQNHTHDKKLLEKIDRLLEDERRSDSQILNDLAGTVPRAGMEFQQGLEDRLMARFQAQEAIRIGSTRVPPAAAHLNNGRQSRRLAIPFTLAAAVLALFVTVGVLVMANRSGGQAQFASSTEIIASATAQAQALTAQPPVIPRRPDVEALLLQATEIIASATAQAQALTAQPPVIPRRPDVEALLQQATAIIATTTAQAQALTALPPTVPPPDEIVVTATPVPDGDLLLQTAPVVIVLGDLQPGQQITEDMLLVTMWPVGYAPHGSFSTVEEVVGMFAAQSVARWQPLLGANLSDEPAPTVPPTAIMPVLPTATTLPTLVPTPTP
jgi:hypothetical protein